MAISLSPFLRSRPRLLLSGRRTASLLARFLGRLLQKTGRQSAANLFTPEPTLPSLTISSVPSVPASQCAALSRQLYLPLSPAFEPPQDKADLTLAASALPTRAAMSSSGAAAMRATEPKCRRRRCSVFGPTPGILLRADSIWALLRSLR